jgi:hypothetical protein
VFEAKGAWEVRGCRGCGTVQVVNWRAQGKKSASRAAKGKVRRVIGQERY